MTRPPTDTPNAVFMGILTSSRTVSSLPMVPTPCRLLGIELFVYGNWQLEIPREDSSVIPMMSCPSPSRQITVRSFPVQGIKRSNCGILLEIVNSPSRRKVTPIGFRVFALAPILRIPSLSVLAGISWSRYVPIVPFLISP